MKKNPAIFIYLLSLAAAFFMGTRFPASNSNSPDSGKNPGEISMEVASGLKSPSNVPNGENLPPSLMPASGLSRELLADAGSATQLDVSSFADLSLQAILDNPDDVDQLFQLTGFLKNLGPENLEEALQIFQQNSSESRDNYSQWNLFMGSWAKFDAEGAITYLADNEEFSGDRKRGLATNVVREWSQKDPMKALEFVQGSSFSDSDKGRLLLTSIETASKTDIQTAIQMANLIENEKTRSRSASMIAESYFDSDPKGAMVWAESLNDPQMKRTALEEITENLAKSDPENAADFALVQFGENVPFKAARSIAEQLSKQDPDSALAFAENIANDKTRQYTVAEIIDEWAKNDPVEAGAYLNDMALSPEWDVPIAAFARRAFDQDPATAMDWAQSISGKEMRAGTMAYLYRNWMKSDRPSADEWLKSQGGDLRGIISKGKSPASDGQ